MAVSVLAVLAVTPAVAAPKPLPPGSLALTLAEQSAAGARSAAPAVTPGSICYFGACYDYVAGRQYNYYATGASVQLWRARPSLDWREPESHSLHELAVQWGDSFQQIVEIGWTVDRSLNGDDAPHLFVYHWVDGGESCYNGCGFVQTSQTIAPGMKMPSGGFSTFRIEHANNRWELSLDGELVGYFPDSLWTDLGADAFSSLLLVQAFGEVASLPEQSPSTCNDMGTGIYADLPASSSVADFTWLGTPYYATDLSGFPFVSTPEWYSIGNLTPTGFRLGGPGSGRC